MRSYEGMSCFIHVEGINGNCDYATTAFAVYADITENCMKSDRMLYFSLIMLLGVTLRLGSLCKPGRTLPAP